MEKLKIFSNTAMMVDRAAKLMKMKNRVPKIRPPAIWLKILGRVTNTSPGPSGIYLESKAGGENDQPGQQGYDGIQRADTDGLAGKGCAPWQYSFRK